MDLQDVKELKNVDASIRLQLYQELERKTFIYWRLYVTFQVYTNSGWRPVRLLVMENRFRHAIYTVLQNSSLEFEEFRLPNSEKPEKSWRIFNHETTDNIHATSNPCKRKCVICHKTSFKTPRRCYNPTVLNTETGQWTCNLER